jgi:hypothetical protein
VTAGKPCTSLGNVDLRQTHSRRELAVEELREPPRLRRELPARQVAAVAGLAAAVREEGGGVQGDCVRVRVDRDDLGVEHAQVRVIEVEEIVIAFLISTSPGRRNSTTRDAKPVVS